MTATTRSFWNATIIMASASVVIATQTDTTPAAPERPVAQAAATQPANDSEKPNTSIHWLASIDSIDEANHFPDATKKVVWLHFMHNGCRACAALEKNVFTDSEIIEYANENFAAVKVNRSTPEGREIAARYGMTNSPDPCDVFVYPGREDKPLRYMQPLKAISVEAMKNRFAGVAANKPE